MSLIDRLFGRRVEKREGSWDRLQVLGIPTLAGGLVSPAVVEGHSAAYAAVQLIAQTLGTLPLYVYRRNAQGVRSVAENHPVQLLFGTAPNDLQTPAEFVTTMQANCLWHGWAAAEVERDGNGMPRALWPVHPGHLAIERIPGTRRIRFQISDETGTRRLLPGEMLVIKDRWDDAYTPRSRLDRAREALGGAIATERFAAATWRNGARLSGIVSHPEQIGPEAAKTLRETLQAIYGGTDNAGKIGVLEEGMSWKEVSATPHDAELSEARRLAVVEVARIFNVPPPMLAALEDATYSNIEAQVRMFATGTIRPWAAAWEQAVRRDLLSEQAARTHQVMFDLDHLLRGDLLTRMQAWRIAREIGAVNANEIREAEGWDPRTDDDASVYFSPANMNREQAGEPKE
jgi:HK97 family phage portal protein